MAFPVDLTAALTGATVNQLQHWRSTGLLDAEFHEGREVLYSFRDLVALRTFVRLRAAAPLQRIRKALRALETMDLTEHPSTYRLQNDGASIVLVDDSGAMDLVDQPGQGILVTLEDVFAPFETKSGRQVADFRQPRPLLEVCEGRLHGWPTIRGTRVTFDTVAKLVSGRDITPADLPLYYPTVSPEAAVQARDFYREVQGIRRRVA